MSTDAEQLLKLRYPIGGPRKADAFTPQERSAAVDGMEQLPRLLRTAVAGFTDTQLDTPYRPDGWTVRQLIHHVADSHMNAYARVRLGLTQDWPVIFAYDENAWAALTDARTEPVTVSLDLLQALHTRFVPLLRSLSEGAWKRGYTHPENGRQSIEQAASLYDWHGRHHTAHITRLAERMGWQP